MARGPKSLSKILKQFPVLGVLGAVVLIGVLLILAVLFNTDLQTRVTQQRFVIAVSGRVAPGSRVTVRWGPADTRGRPRAPSTANRRTFPREKIELVVRQPNGNTRRYVLLARTPNDGGETVRVPANIAEGARVSFRVTAVDRQGRIQAAVKADSSATLTLAAAPPAPPPSESQSGGDGGGGGGGGSSNASPPQASGLPVRLSYVFGCIEPSPDLVTFRWEAAEHRPMEESVMLLYRRAGDTEWQTAPTQDITGDPVQRKSRQVLGTTTLWIGPQQFGRRSALEHKTEYEVAFRHLPSGETLPNKYRFSTSLLPENTQQGCTEFLKEGESRVGPWSYKDSNPYITRSVPRQSDQQLGNFISASPTTRVFRATKLLWNPRSGFPASDAQYECEAVLSQAQASVLGTLVETLRGTPPVEQGPSPAGMTYIIGFRTPSPVTHTFRAHQISGLGSSPVDFQRLEATLKDLTEDLCGFSPAPPPEAPPTPIPQLPPEPNGAVSLQIWEQNPTRASNYWGQLTLDLRTGEFRRHSNISPFYDDTCAVLSEQQVMTHSPLIGQLQALPRVSSGENFGRRGQGQEWTTVTYNNNTTHGAFANTTSELPEPFRQLNASLKQLAIDFCTPPKVQPPHTLGD